MAHELSHPESETEIRLEVLLSQLRDAATHLVAPDSELSNLPDGAALRTTLRRADAVLEAWMALQRSNPNRQLLLEALLLRLAAA